MNISARRVGVRVCNRSKFGISNILERWNVYTENPVVYAITDAQQYYLIK